MQMDGIKDRIQLFSKNKGLFITADYLTPKGEIETAMGELDTVDEETGDIIIVHLKDERIFWGFNLSKLESYKFSPIKGGERQ